MVTSNTTTRGEDSVLKIQCLGISIYYYNALTKDPYYAPELHASSHVSKCSSMILDSVDSHGFISAAQHNRMLVTEGQSNWSWQLSKS